MFRRGRLTIVWLFVTWVGRVVLCAEETPRLRPSQIPGLSAEERAAGGYVAFRTGPGTNSVILLAFLAQDFGAPVSEMVVCVPGHPRFGPGVRFPAERRRRDEKGPAEFDKPVLIQLGAGEETLAVELLDVEKRPRRGKLVVRIRRTRGVGTARKTVELLGVLKQAGGEENPIPELSLDVEPTLRLHAVQNGRKLYAALRCGEWSIVMPGRRPAFPAEVLNDRGGVVETAALRQAEDPLLKVYEWTTDLRKLQGGSNYTLKVTVTPGAGYPPLVASIPVAVPAIPDF